MCGVIFMIGPNMQIRTHRMIVGLNKFPDMPCMSRAYRDNNASAHWSAARSEERVSFWGARGTVSGLRDA